MTSQPDRRDRGSSMSDIDTNRIRNWAKAYQRLQQGGLGERAHTAGVEDFAADDGEYPYITAEDVLAMLGEIENQRWQADTWRRVASTTIISPHDGPRCGEYSLVDRHHEGEPCLLEAAHSDLLHRNSYSVWT